MPTLVPAVRHKVLGRPPLTSNTGARRFLHQMVITAKLLFALFHLPSHSGRNRISRSFFLHIKGVPPRPLVRSISRTRLACTPSPSTGLLVGNASNHLSCR